MLENNTILQELLSFAHMYQVPCMSWATKAYLLHHLTTYKPRSCLEIGTAIGYSTSIIASTISYWQGHLCWFEISYPSYMRALHTLYRLQLHNTCIYHSDILRVDLTKIQQSALRDFVFIDGAKREYASYLEQILPFCAPWYTILCDDVCMYPDKVAPIYDIIAQHKLKHSIITMDDGDGLLLIQGA